MDLRLRGKIALVTGSSKGIGEGIARSLHQEGCNVVLNSRHRVNLKSIATSMKERVGYFAADVTKINDCESLINYTIRKFGRLDILVCNVGSGMSVTLGKETVEDLQKMLNINLMSAINAINAAKKEIIKSKGNIICISSIAGVEVTDAPVGYTIAKSALNTYVKNISKYFGQFGVRMNIIAPGNIFFKGSVWEKKLKQNPIKIKKFITNQVPLKRFGTPKEIGDTVAFLASPLSSFTSGSVLIIDGGQVKS